MLRASLWYEKAWCLRELGRADEAAEAYQQVIDQDAEHGIANHALLELAEIEFEAGRYRQSVDLLQRVNRNAAADPTVPLDLRRQCIYRLGLGEFHMGNHGEAARLLGMWLDDEPDPEIVASARLLCAEALIRTGSYGKATEHLNRVIAEHPSHEAAGPSKLRLGEAYAAQHQWPLSEQTFGQYLQQWPDSELWFQAKFGVGWARENQQRYDGAIESYREVIDRHNGPTAARAQFQIGECLFAQKKYDDAVSELLKVDILYAYPEWSAAAIYEAGRCFQESGNPVEARKQYEYVQVQHAQTEWAERAARRLQEIADRTLPGH